MERVDWKSAKPEDYEYLRSRMGTLPIPLDENDLVTKHGLQKLAQEVANAILDTIHTNVYTRPDGYRTPDLVAEEGLNIPPEERDGTNQVYKAVMQVGLWLAKMDPWYWGVKDPATESFCSGCRRARPLKEFTYHESRCDSCCTGGTS